MAKEKIKERISKVDDRIIVMVKKYPFVFAAVILIGVVIGFVVGKFL